MVLQEIEQGPPSDSFISDDNPSSDSDNYDGPSSRPPSGPHSHSIDVNTLPKPLPILGPLGGYTNRKLAYIIGLDVARCQSIVQRPLTQDEFDALAYHCAKLQSISSYGYPLGLAGGLYRCSVTAKTWRFPFWQPEMTASADGTRPAFNPQRLGPWEGARAEWGWTWLRRMSYGSVGAAVGGALLGAYATSVAVTGQRLDERLQDIYAELRRIGPDESRRRRVEQIRQAQAGGARGGMPAAPVVPGPAQAKRTESAYDDASPSGGMFSDEEVQQSQYQQEQSTATPQYASEQAYARRDVPRQADGFLDEEDDASPTARGGATGAAGDDVWASLRRGGQAQTSQQSRSAPPPQGQAQAQGDVWARMRGGSGQDSSSVGDGSGGGRY